MLRMDFEGAIRIGADPGEATIVIAGDRQLRLAVAPGEAVRITAKDIGHDATWTPPPVLTTDPGRVGLTAYVAVLPSPDSDDWLVLYSSYGVWTCRARRTIRMPHVPFPAPAPSPRM